MPVEIYRGRGNGRSHGLGGGLGLVIPSECVALDLSFVAVSSVHVETQLYNILIHTYTSNIHVPMPAEEESNFFVNLSPISVMREVKQKKVSASA